MAPTAPTAPITTCFTTVSTPATASVSTRNISRIGSSSETIATPPAVFAASVPRHSSDVDVSKPAAEVDAVSNQPAWGSTETPSSGATRTSTIGPTRARSSTGRRRCLWRSGTCSEGRSPTRSTLMVLPSSVRSSSRVSPEPRVQAQQPATVRQSWADIADSE